MSLQIGSDLYDIASSQGTSILPATPLPTSTQGDTKSDPDQADSKPPNSTSQLDSKPPLPLPSASTSASTSHTYLCTPAPSEQVLQTEAKIYGTLSLLPTSMNSSTHLELARHVEKSHMKHSRMKVLREGDEGYDVLVRKAAGIMPDIKKSGRGGGRSKRDKLDRDIWSDDEDGVSSRRTRGAGRSNGGGGSGGGRKRGDDDGEEDEESEDGFIVDDSDDEGGGMGGDGSDESDFGGGGRRSKKRNGAGGGKKRKSARGGEVEELDEMEVAEKRIEEQERERKRAKRDRHGGKKEKVKKSRDYADSDEDGEEDAEGEEEMDMDVESEDE